MTELALVCFVVGAGSWLMALHPFVTYPLSLLLIARRREVKSILPTAHLDNPSIAVCTCAYNEASVIEAKILNLLALRQRYGILEIFLYIDASDDSTAEIAAKYGAQLTLVVSTDRHGKTHGMNQLVALAQTELIVFTDANVILDLDSLVNLVRHFHNKRVGCVCGNLIYTNSSESVTAATGSLYWRLEQWIKSRESLRGSVMGADGSIFAIRRKLHTAPPDDIIDDMYVSFKILCSGHEIVQALDVRAFEESVAEGAEEFRRKIRIACQAYNVHRLLWNELSERLAPTQLYMYLSHKLLRWFCIYFISIGSTLLVLGLLLVHREILAACAVLSVGCLLWAAGQWRLPFVTSVRDVLMAMLGTGIGVARSIRGDRFQTWQPATSIRR